MKRFFLFVLFGVVLCSCSASYKLSNSVWYNVTEGEYAGVKGDIVTSLYFINKNEIQVNVCVKQGSTIIVPITTIAYGTYTQKGNLKKGVRVEISTSDLYDNQHKQYGVIVPEGMVLSETDSVAKVYSKSNIILK